MHYKVGYDEAEEYIQIMLSDETGIQSLITLLSKYGFNEKEIKGLLK